jgi:mannose-1-phosphate guanylyltransferase
MNFIPVILCGGSGSRLFPLSRDSYPKQFLNLNGNLSLLQNTIKRFNNMPEIVLVSNAKHKNILLNQIKYLIDNNLLLIKH